MAENPRLVRPITLPHKTWEGRSVEGVEITTNVDNLRDGKPVFLQMGVHHAREWPSGEHAIEWAFELVNSYKAGDERARRVVSSVRAIVIPLVNPDGFNNGWATIRVEWASAASDYDIEVYRDANGNGAVDSGETVEGDSGQGHTDFEQVTLGPDPTGRYILRVVNFAAAEPYDVLVTFDSPTFTAAQRENWSPPARPRAGPCSRAASSTWPAASARARAWPPARRRSGARSRPARAATVPPGACAAGGSTASAWAAAARRTCSPTGSGASRRARASTASA